VEKLRQLIRSIILEANSKYQQKIYDRQDLDWRVAFGYKGSPRGKRPDTINGVLQDPYPEETVLRRDIKRIWNENSDQLFFQNEVTCIHWINYIHGHKSSSRSYVKALKRILNGNPPIPPGSISKNEFSTLGYVGAETEEYRGDGIIGIKIDPDNSYVSFAAVVDSWTEYNYGTPKNTREYYKSSGLPKRPARNISSDKVIFNKEDFIKSGADMLKECVVDNWSWDTLVIDESYINNEHVVELIDYVENNWNISNTDSIINIEYF